MNYNLIIEIDDQKIIMPVQYEKEYELRRDVTSMGINGVWQKVDELLYDFKYTPPHKIQNIYIKEIK